MLLIIGLPLAFGDMSEGGRPGDERARLWDNDDNKT